MFRTSAGTLLLVLGAAFLAPLISARFRSLRLPALVFEIVLGMLLGPDVLDLVRVTDSIRLLANLGLATLIFLAGFELDLDQVRGRPLRLALSGWVVSVVLGLAVASGLLATGVIKAELYVAFAFTTTALGTLLPIIRDEGLLGTPFGVHVLAVGSVGELLPIIAIALLLSGTDPSNAALALVAFAAVSVGAVVVALRSRPGRIRRELGRTLRSSGQLYIRLALALIALMTFLAAELGLDFLLGAFMAGIVYRLYVSAGAPEAELEVMETNSKRCRSDTSCRSSSSSPGSRSISRRSRNPLRCSRSRCSSPPCSSCAGCRWCSIAVTSRNAAPAGRWRCSARPACH